MQYIWESTFLQWLKTHRDSVTKWVTLSGSSEKVRTGAFNSVRWSSARNRFLFFW
jgi:hypothetical protein